MATVFWLGTVQAVAGVRRVTFAGTPAAGNVVTTTVTGSGKAVRYTLVTGDTTATTATNFADAWNASADREVTEIRAEVDPNNSSAVLFTGPADGATFTLTSGATGGGITATDANVTTEAGPHDLANVANYSSGALPAASDTLDFRDAANGPKYNLTALTAISLNVVRRYASFTGQWGLPATNPNGYQEYRTQFLELDTDSLVFDATLNDAPEQFRLRAVNAALTAIRIAGTSNPGGVGQSPNLELYGTVTGSTLAGSGASVGVALRKGQTAVLASVDLSDSRVDLGDGVSAAGAVFLNNCTGTVRPAAYTTYEQAGSSDVTVSGSAAAGTSTEVNGGTLRWNSAGTPNTTDVAGGAVFDLSFCPVDLPNTVDINQHRGSAVYNPAGRIAAGWTRTLVRCGPQDVTYLGPPDEVLTVN